MYVVVLIEKEALVKGQRDDDDDDTYRRRRVERYVDSQIVWSSSSPKFSRT